ncbi:MAG TPA: hypothetical protein VGA55_05635, partial [Bacteroidota bacterium]
MKTQSETKALMTSFAGWMRVSAQFPCQSLHKETPNLEGINKKVSQRWEPGVSWLLNLGRTFRQILITSMNKYFDVVPPGTRRNSPSCNYRRTLLSIRSNILLSRGIMNQ